HACLRQSRPGSVPKACREVNAGMDDECAARMVRYPKMPKTPRSTILVVDDEAEICDLVSYNLAREGYRVLQEHDGEAGLNRVFQSAPDLLILDLLLPKM